MAQKTLTWTPIGGLGEVGKNMMAFEYNDAILIVDTGIMFPESDMFGIDAVIPDYTWLKEKRDKIKGIVITHGHEDHTGAVAYVVKEFPGLPIYATPLTRGLLEVKLREAKALDRATLNTVPVDGSAQIGPFKIEFFRMCHSIPDNVGLGITTPVGLIVHSGDFKFDHTPVDGLTSDFAKLAEFAGRGVLALFSDSTNAENPGITPSEREIEPALELVFRDAEGRIIVATFASLISRIQQVANICQIYGRKLAFAGTSMVENVKMAQKMGYLQLPEGLVVKLEETNKMDPATVCIMATGSQGEPSAVLGRIAMGRHQVINAQPGDTYVLSAHPIPGNEEAIHRIINRLFQKGANVIYPQLARVHVSGHASQEEQKLLLSLLRPKFFIPIHGELRMLNAHKRLAQSLGIPSSNIFVGENGTPIEFTSTSATQLERMPGGYVFVDGSGVGDIGPVVLKDREALARDGFVLVIVRRDEKGGLRENPEIITRGFVYMKEAEELIKAMSEAAGKELSNITASTSTDAIRSRVGEAAGKFIANETRRRPMLITVVA
ncbi:MAG TPA: ribonuclease J [Thermoflexales bacterium]|nr:ribonuclease J [Thermoflexales bacterium]HQW36109.1 ribonuclease J [Thermoflexales bacterium]HQZ23158.1 ribonuclease J [Thermoflexales bacterium]HRA01079.1 ribonuclease J [Thermoflexales bacterium]